MNENQIENLARGLMNDFSPLPNITPLQKHINFFYITLRLYGLSEKETSIVINDKLRKHGITKEQILNPEE